MRFKITRLRIGLFLCFSSMVAGAALCVQYGHFSHARAKSSSSESASAANLVLAPTAPSDYAERLVAYIYDSIPITRRDLGEFLILRFGVANVDKMVGQFVIEQAAAGSGVTITPAEIEAEVTQTIKDSHMNRQQFTELIVPRYARNLLEWQEDVIKSRLLLSKMCRDSVSVTEDELRRGFESTCGDKIRARVIMWPKEDKDEAAKELVNIQKNEAEFDRCAREQKDEKLAAKNGEIELFHNFTSDILTERAAFALKPGEVSNLIETLDGWMVIKCMEHLPPISGFNYEDVREDIRREAMNRKLYKEAIPHFLDGLKRKSHPKILLKKGAGEDSSGEKKSASEAIAIIYDNIPVTRENLGQWLIERYGAEEIERLVIQETVEHAVAEQGLVLHRTEIDADLANTLKDLHLTSEQLEKTVLKPRGLSLAAWRADETVRLKLARLCRDRVKVTEDDVQKAYTAAYGEKLQVRIITWPAKEQHIAISLYPKIRDSEEEFDRAARTQGDSNLAARGGEVEPFGRYSTGNEEMEKAAFHLKPGEVSHLIPTPEGFVVVKCVKRLPPQKDIKLADVRLKLSAECAARKLRQVEIPQLCKELHEQAHPKIFLKKESYADLRREVRSELADK